MEGYSFLWELALILGSTKLFGLITKKFNMPQVVGALLAGLLLGPAVLGNIVGSASIGGFQLSQLVLHESTFIKTLAEIGVIVLMFNAGLGTDINELKKCGLSSFIIAALGVVVPLVGGGAFTYWFFQEGWINSMPNTSTFLQAVFIGVILTATSVSITVETLQELGKLKTSSGNAILGAAIIDDILGIIALTIVTSFATKGGANQPPMGLVLLKIVLFFVFVAVFGFIVYKLFKLWMKRDKKVMHRHVIGAFVICLLMAFCAEAFFGVADITGAFFAGVIISMTQKDQFIASKFDVIGYLFLSPVFFASIGMQVDGKAVSSMGTMIIVYAVLLTLIAIVTKVVGCGGGAKLCKYNNYQSLRIGVGMISRGEVALIVANKGIEANLMSKELVAPVILVVLITTIITPIILKPVFMNFGPNAVHGNWDTRLARNYEQREAKKRNMVKHHDVQETNK